MEYRVINDLENQPKIVSNAEENYTSFFAVDKDYSRT